MFILTASLMRRLAAGFAESLPARPETRFEILPCCQRPVLHSYRPAGVLRGSAGCTLNVTIRTLRLPDGPGQQQVCEMRQQKWITKNG
jgi:hypothetical protein